MASVHDNNYVNDMADIKKLLSSDENKGKQICLWVIDMQNDFIDAPFQDTTLFNKDDYNKTIEVAPGTKLLLEPFKKVETRQNWKKVNTVTKDNIDKGRFALNEGIQCIEDVLYYIKLLTEDEKYSTRLKQIIFSRDIHTDGDNSKTKDKNPNHCSFVMNPTEGFVDGIGFPAHCVNGTAGCLLQNKIKDICKLYNDKSLVVMKGCSQEYDSFGAFPYDCEKGKEYSNKRQHNGCKHTCSVDNKSIDKNTGSYILNDTEQFNLSVDLNTKRDKIKDKIDSIGGANMIHLVCGLAGDYCVRDTAINLKFAYPNSTVAVIADATRYAALYDSVIVPDTLIPNVFENSEKRTEFLENTLHLKSFIDNPVPLPTYFLTPPDVMLYTYSNKMLPGEGVVFTMDNERKSNLNYTKPSNSDRPTREPDNPYWCLSRFYYLLGKQKQKCLDKRIECYKNAKGFKDNEYNGKRVGRLSLDYPSPVTRPTQGGKRRRRKTKKRHNKKTKRKVTKKRHHKKTKKRKVRKTKKNKTRKR